MVLHRVVPLDENREPLTMEELPITNKSRGGPDAGSCLWHLPQRNLMKSKVVSLRESRIFAAGQKNEFSLPPTCTFAHEPDPDF